MIRTNLNRRLLGLFTLTKTFHNAESLFQLKKDSENMG
ncbi:hypothetical protein MICA_414 [Micavibrio aeruginosavorus ARL-13]|uniref:Uncharacterized protein n=1 Tax=Micavibrio aeruginosavorus (strain ARL-13) TaxID=856793 RepID=G2KS75_MICAA|nr:hypothetical protein MICA_414 [Micavibrio aeruginosavorus ARL-13]